MFAKVITVILALLFVSFVSVQFDDPDPLLWVLIYTNMVIICAWSAFRLPNRYWIWLTGIAYLIYAISLFPGAMDWFKSPDRSLLFDDLAKMQYPYIEETREFLGLIISLLVLFWIAFRFRSKR